MNRPIFVDTSAWLAMAVTRDRYHRKAAAFYRKIAQERTPLITSNYVLVETYTRIRYDDGHEKAVSFHDIIIKAVQAGRLHVEWIGPSLHNEAWKIFRDFDDQEFSFVDCTSFVIARRQNVEAVFAFDHHFSTMGFVLKPQ